MHPSSCISLYIEKTFTKILKQSSSHVLFDPMEQLFVVPKKSTNFVGIEHDKFANILKKY